jgi:hypothetical protein
MFFLNEQVASCSFEWRLLFIGLLTQADRAGRMEDRPLRLKAELFPYDAVDVNAGLDALVAAGLITRYEVAGRRLVAVKTFSVHQQPHVKEAPSQLPGPPNEHEHGASTVLAPQEGKGREQEGKGKEHQAALRARFERFWSEYPKKVGKDAAWQVWLQRAPVDDLTDRMIAALREQRASAQWLKESGQFIPHPRTWLSQGRWQDEVEKTLTPASTRATDAAYRRTQELIARPVRRTS